jgi:UDP-perosamine 4-acetyltransferase
MKDKVIIIGASGHAKVIIDILKNNNEYELVGCIDSAPSSKKILDLPILGTDEDLPKLLTQGITHTFIAIGDNRTRKKVAEKVTQLGFNLINAISRFSYISSTVQLGKGIAVMPGAIINVDSIIGDNAIINTGASVDHDGTIGAYSHIAPGTNLAGNVRFGEGVFCGVGCKIIPQITIGEWSIIGAGATVITDIPAHVTSVGIPAKIKNYHVQK